MSAQVVPVSGNFTSRTMALVIDFAILTGMQLIIFAFGAILFLHEIRPADPMTLFVAYPLFLAGLSAGFVILHMFYFTIFHAWFGQTIGKMIMGIKVIAQDNGRISPAVSFLRWTGYILSAVPLTAGFLWSAVDRDQCTWHDRLAGTRVVAVEMT